MLNDTCLNQNRYSNNDAREVVTRLALKLGIDENEIFEKLIIFVYKKGAIKTITRDSESKGEVCCEQGQLCA